METLPTNEIVYAFAYGSGVFSQQPKQQQQQQPEQNKQQQYDPKNRMVDLIIVVKDSFQFHLQNYRRNPMHYWTPPYWMIPLAFPSLSSSLLHSQPEQIRQQQQQRIRKGTMIFGKQQQQHEETLALWFTQLQRGLWKQQQPQTRSGRGGGGGEGSEWEKNDTQSLWNGFWGGTYPTTTTFINPGVYFNLVNNNDNNETNTISSFKYGIVQVEDLLDDLKHWNCLYLAGRMHKPIVPLSLLSSSSFDHYSKQQQQQWKTVIESYQQNNLIAALSTALLLLLSSSTPLSLSSSTTTTTTTTRQQRRRSLQQSHKLQFMLSEQDIYRTIAELSYRGDYRMYTSAEDPNKITNLITSPGQLQRFRNLYEPCWNHLIHELHLPLSLLQQEQQSSPCKGFGNNTNKNKNRNKNDTLNNNLLQTWMWEVDDDNVHATNPLSSSSSSPFHLLWSQLPTSIVPPNPHFSTSTTTTSSQQSKWLSNQLSMRVAASSQCQSIKGIVTVGPQKAYQYAIRKLIKGRRWSWSSWFRR